jgi:hypothetical protein
MKLFSIVAILIEGLILTICICALLLTARSTVASIPIEIQLTRSALLHQVDALRITTLSEIDKQALGVRRDALGQLTVIRKDAVQQLSEVASMADRQLTGTRSDLRHTVAESVSSVVAPIEGLRSDLKPLIASAGALTTNAAALTKDVQDSIDDAYPDIQGLLQSTTVAATQIAQTAEVVRETAPEFLATSQETNRQFAGIGKDVHTFTTEFVKPKSLKSKIWEGVKALSLVIAKAI